MERLQQKIVDRWKVKKLDLMDTSRMQSMAREAVNVVQTTEPDYNLGWGITIAIVAISTFVSWILIYLAVNPNFE